jgi:hypothetical protein
MVQNARRNDRGPEGSASRLSTVPLGEGEIKGRFQSERDHGHGVTVGREVQPGSQVGRARAPHPDAGRRLMKSLRHGAM